MKRRQGVHVGTIHSTKGLEFDSVFLMRCYVHSLPWKYQPKHDPPPRPSSHPWLHTMDVSQWMPARHFCQQ